MPWSGGSASTSARHPGRNVSFVCQANWLPALAGNDSGGYSECMIPAAENSGGGSDLGIFYYDNKVIRCDRVPSTRRLTATSGPSEYPPRLPAAQPLVLLPH